MRVPMRTIVLGMTGAPAAALAAAASAETDAATAELTAARAARYPNLTASSTTMRFNETPAFDFGGAGLPVVLPLFSGSSMTMAEARVTLPVFTGGALAANVLS